MRWTRHLTLAAVAGLVATGLAVAPAAGAETKTVTARAASTAVHAVDTADLTVLYKGQLISSDRAAALQLEAEAAQREFVLVYDPASSDAGLAHAFDSRAAADAYGATQGTKTAPAQRQTTKDTGTATTMGALPTTCGALRHQSRLYDGANCAGDSFTLFRVDDEPSFKTYGWANKANSIVVGSSDCIILVRLYPGPNYTFTEARFYGSASRSEYYAFNSAQYNNFKSGRSTCS